ncbi:MAG: DUF1573 domain-containing protein [Crocinitomix sp.]|nr:DUF1573 domain-containing protein [Crocinitomix sp.]
MRLFFAIIIALSSAFTFRSGAEFSFLDRNHDFTDVKEGAVLEHDFAFTNIGDSPLVISDYKVACTCTKITFSNEPVLPNQKGIIHLSFDTKGKFGFQSRKIEIVSNAKKMKLSFRVFVVRS